MTSQIQQKHEFQIFERFLRACPIAFDGSSIVQENPPNPDISCRDMKGNIVRFELTEVLSESAAKGLSQLSLGDRIEGRLSNYPRRNELLDLFTTKQICLEFYDYFDNESALHVRRKRITEKVILGAAHRVFDLLLAPQSQGKQHVHPYLVNDRYLQRILADMIITERPDFNPSLFDAGSAIDYESADELLLRGIISKCAKEYPHQDIHLIAYFDFQPTNFWSFWDKRLTRLCKRQISHSRFSNLWVFTTFNNTIFYRYPPGEHCFFSKPMLD